ncbi:histidine phosphatase family protein [Acetobacter oeni]|uniref:histidine phosphatase family protein n=1 Tax=Acetobacter oeni TaxID=304077 RepID=UPI0011BED174|nr:histidine phosphatase family protein [Acetobacter oeni]MBB3883758.1 alpha-ribazole phosphatase [Acetobacter oeni]NHO19896.1 phosphoglycerate mutase [Acetobacter oeni]
MVVCCIARHPSVTVRPGICYGHLDVPLAEKWEDFAARLIRALRQTGVTRLYASPLSRCRIPAEYSAAIAGISVCLDPRLAELDFGTWEGQLWNDMPRAELDRWAADLMDFAPPEGESGRVLCERVTAFHADLPSEETCAILSHGGPLRVLQSLVEGRAPDLSRPALPSGEILTFSPVTQPEAAEQPVRTERPSRRVYRL